MKIAVFGANGRVGKAVCEVATVRGHEVFPIECGDDTTTLGNVDVVIDFSTADATHSVCEFAKKRRVPLITGVTGRTDAQKEEVRQTAQQVTVCESANFSKGIAAMLDTVKTLAALNWDCEIVEIHRKGKVDRPSGTAKMLCAALQQHGTRCVTLHSLRVGSNFGEHQVIFATEGESITVTHRAENVRIFALGAVERAEEICRKTASKGGK